MLVNKELLTLYSKLEQCSYAEMQYAVEDSTMVLPTLNLKWKSINRSQRLRQEKQIQEFLKIRLELDTVVVSSTL